MFVGVSAIKKAAKVHDIVIEHSELPHRQKVSALIVVVPTPSDYQQIIMAPPNDPFHGMVTSGYAVTTKGVIYSIAGHWTHHLEIIKERYL